MADGISIGIRAEEGYQKPRLILKDGNYRYWSTVIEPMLREKKVWGHVQGTVPIPGPILVLGTGAMPGVPAVPEIVAAMGVAAVPAVPAVAANAGVTQAQVDASRVAFDHYSVNEARANSMILLTLDPKDVMTLIAYVTAASKWAKLAADHVSITASKGINANQKFQSFVFSPGETVYQTRQRFDGLVTECALQGIVLSETLKSTVLLTHPTDRWRTFIDSISLQAPLPTTAIIFQQMIILAEKWEARDEKEHAEANFADFKRRTRQPPTGGQRRVHGQNQGQQQQPRREALQPGSANPCFCCGSFLHLFAKCPKKDLSCNSCKKKGHLAHMCNRGGEASATTHKATVDSPSTSGGKPKKVEFVGGTKRASALKSANEAMAAEIVEVEAGEVCDVSHDEWLADSGASRHICNDIRMLWDVRQLPEPIIVRQLVGEVPVRQSGTVKIQCENQEGDVVQIDLHDALFVPDLRVNLFSMQRMRQASIRLEYPSEIGTIWMLNNSGNYIGSLDESYLGRPTLNCRTLLYDPADYNFLPYNSDAGPGATEAVAEQAAAAADVTGDSSAAAPAPSVAADSAVAEAASEASGQPAEVYSAIQLDLLHRRTGHAALSTLHQLTRGGLVRGLEGGITGKLGTCRGCMLGKPLSKPHPSKNPAYRAESPLQLVHADLAGPIKPASWGGSRYLFVLTDDFSRKSWVVLLAQKSDVEMRLKQWLVQTERECGHSVGRLRTDNGGEFTKQSLKDWLALRGVTQEFSPPRSPQSNGVAERMNRTLQDKARSMMAQTGLRGGSWGEIFLAASYLRNRGPVSNQKLTPQELWTGRKPSVAHFRSFGCKVYVPLIKGMRGGKLGEVRREGVLIGYADNSPSYRVWDPVKGKVLNAGGCEFDEEVGPGWWLGAGEVGAGIKTEDGDVQFPDLEPAAGEDGKPFPLVLPLSLPPPLPPADAADKDELPPLVEDDSDDEGGDEDNDDTSDPPPRRSNRSNRGVPPLRYDDIYAAAVDLMCPATVKEALGGDKAEMWAAAMDKELESLWQNKVYVEVTRPPGKKVIGSKWVLRIKTDAEGKVDKFKARVVAKGFRQIEGVDYGDTFAPTVRFESIRSLIAMGVAEGWNFDQMDVSTAFLYAELEEETYVEVPEGISGVEGMVWKLLKCLYGLKQSPRMWNQTMDKVLEEIGFVRFKSDHGVYVFGVGDERVFIALYVDDLLMMWKSREVLDHVKSKLQEKFDMKDLGVATFLLGIELRRKDGGDLFMVQQKYALEVVRKFGMSESKVASTPFEPGSILGVEGGPKDEDERESMLGVPYRSLVGSLMYLAVCTRPDIAMGVSTLSRFCQDPGLEHWEAAKRLLRYVKGSAGEGLLYAYGEDVALWGYSDASYGNDSETKRGRSGFVMMSGGAAISWGSKLQEVVALSSTEAEYMALTHAAQEALYLSQLQSEMGVVGDGHGVLLLCDNQSSIKIAQNPVFHKRSKHIAIRFHFIRERVESSEILLQFVRTKDMAADQLTKHVGLQVLETGKELMGMFSG